MIDVPYLRHKAGLSQRALARLMGWSRSKIQRHEDGGRISPEDAAWYLKKLKEYRK